MIYQLKQVLIDIKSVSTNPKRNLIVGKNGEILKNGEIIFKGGKYLFANNLINENYYNYGDNQYQFLFENDMEIFLNNYVTNSISTEGVIVFENVVITDTIKQDNYYLKFSDNSKILLNENAVGGFILNYDNNAKSIFRSYNKLSSYSLLTGEYEWELDLGLQDLEISSILGVKEDNLIFLCNKEIHKNILLALDIRTGEEVWARDMNFGRGGFILNADSSAVINLYAGGFWLNGVRFGAGHNIFREINIKDGSIKREGTLKDLDEAGLGISTYTLYEDKIYFTADYQGSFSGVTVGVLDYETLALLWWEEVKMEDANGFGNFLTQIQASENKIYALDKTGTLHIYERDETIPFEKPTKSGLLAFEDMPAQNIDNQNFNETDDLPF